MSVPRPGAQAEQFVAHLLAEQRWRILARNWRRRGCELDIVACREMTLIIVEVKFRRIFIPYAADLYTVVSPKKIAALRKGARCFLTHCPQPQVTTIRCDLALVTPATISSTQNSNEHLFKLFYYGNFVSL